MDVEDSSIDPTMGDGGCDMEDDGLPCDIPTTTSWRVCDRYLSCCDCFLKNERSPLGEK